MNLDISLKPNIIYKDKDFLVIEKPAGLIVHSTKYQKKNTLVDWLEKHYPEVLDIGPKNRPGIVHRLDKDVSGLMVIALSGGFFRHAVEQFKDGRVKKEYLALVHGVPPEGKGVIEAPIGWTKNGKLVAVRSRKKIKLEKEAVTRYEIIKKFKRYSLLKVEPLTGRTHQIRLHLAFLGSPIVGEREDDLGRIFLHAASLGFFDLDNNWRQFRSELPMELKNFLNKIGGKYG